MFVGIEPPTFRLQVKRSADCIQRLKKQPFLFAFNLIIVDVCNLDVDNECLSDEVPGAAWKGHTVHGLEQHARVLLHHVTHAVQVLAPTLVQQPSKHSRLSYQTTVLSIASASVKLDLEKGKVCKNCTPD